MTEKTGKLNVRLIVLILWLTLAYFYASLAYDYITVSNKDKRLEEYLQYVVVEAGDARRPPKEVRSLVLYRADQLNIPLRPDQVGVSGSGSSLKIGVIYEVDIDLPIFHRTIYHKTFPHQASYRNIR